MPDAVVGIIKMGINLAPLLELLPLYGVSLSPGLR